MNDFTPGLKPWPGVCSVISLVFDVLCGSAAAGLIWAAWWLAW
jgi:hypothetical protein